MSPFLVSLALLALCIALAGALPQPALIKVVTTGEIGVILDEFPSESLNNVEHWLLARPNSYWDEAVRRQLSLTSYRLLYRNLYYDASENKGALPLPINELKITFTSTPKRGPCGPRTAVSRKYSMTGYIVTDVNSAAASDPALGTIGGTTIESFVLPLDPYLTYQRTGYACMDESQFPLDSVDSEGPLYFFDDYCEGEEPYDISSGEGCNQCHCTTEVTTTCIDAMKRNTGRAPVDLKYTRVALNMTLVNQIEAQNIAYTSTQGADMVGSIPGMEHHYIVYKYIAEDSCTIKECNGGGFGWRRLMYFDATHVNAGTKPLEIGEISYLKADPTSFDPLTFHNLYYWDTCHQHPHFTGYAEYNWGPTLGHKQGFCVMSTGREVNSRWSPITNAFYDCSHQGIQQGWSDAYNAGIPCQWIDVSAVNTNAGSVTKTLTMTSNHKNWLCEGVINRDANGNPLWVPTGEFTATGQSIDKHSCTPTPGALTNNIDNIQATIPKKGNGLITAPCFESGHSLGPKRDCELNLRTQIESCTPGKRVKLACSAPYTAKPQVLRVCEASKKLNSGLACRYNDDSLLANEIVRPGSSTPVTFTCPTRRDVNEPGGYFSTYSGPVFNSDNTATITCTVQ